MGFKIILEGTEALEDELIRLSSIRWEAVVKNNMRQIYNRAVGGGTPVDTGELRMSCSLSGDLVSYGASYAAHVEYGHRTRNGGFVRGQRYLKHNVDTQRPIYYNDLRKQLNKG